MDRPMSDLMMLLRAIRELETADFIWAEICPDESEVGKSLQVRQDIVRPSSASIILKRCSATVRTGYS
jgi:hypothetical protein